MDVGPDEDKAFQFLYHCVYDGVRFESRSLPRRIVTADRCKTFLRFYFFIKTHFNVVLNFVNFLILGQRKNMLFGDYFLKKL